MHPFSNKRLNQIALYVFLVSVAVILFAVLIINLKTVKEFLDGILSVFSPLIYGFIIAYLVNPIMKMIEKHLLRFREIGRFAKISKKIKRPLSVALSMLTFLLIIAILVGLVIPQVARSFQELESKITDYIAAAQSMIDSFIRHFPLFNGQYDGLADILGTTDAESIIREITADLNSMINNLYSLLISSADYVINYASRFVIEVKNALIGFIIAIYFLLAKERIIGKAKKSTAAFLSQRHYINLISLCRFTDKTIGGFIYGKIIDSIIIGLLTFIVMTIFKMPFAPLNSMIIGITNVIPFFGPFIGAIPTAFIVFIADPNATIWFLLMVFAIQQLDGNVIGPKILGDTTGLTSLAVLLSITIAGGFFGFAGMILGVPAAAILCALFKQWTDSKLRLKKASTDPADYLNNLPVRDYTTEPIFLDKREPIPPEYTLPTVSDSEDTPAPPSAANTENK